MAFHAHKPPCAGQAAPLKAGLELLLAHVTRHAQPVSGDGGAEERVEVVGAEATPEAVRDALPGGVLVIRLAPGALAPVLALITGFVKAVIPA